MALAFAAGDIVDSVKEAFFMFWATLWALVLGFGLSGAVQAFVAKEDMQRVMGDHRPACGRALDRLRHGVVELLVRGDGDGEVAVPEGRRLRRPRWCSCSPRRTWCIELGVVLFVLMGWQFAAAEFIGGPIMIVLLVIVGGHVFSRRYVERARRRLQRSQGHSDAHRVEELERTPWRQKLTSAGAWADAASYSIADMKMLRKELVIGYGVAGFLAVAVPMDVWNDVFFTGHGFWSTLQNVILGPFIAFISFVCSVGNVPMAAALWHGGISFGGVISFIFADFIALPLVLIYRKYYGRRLAIRLFFTFWLVMSTAGLIVEGTVRRPRLDPGRRGRAKSCTPASSGTTRRSSTSCSSFCSGFSTGCTATGIASKAAPARLRSDLWHAGPHRRRSGVTASRRRAGLVLLGPLCGAVRRDDGPLGVLSDHDSIVAGCFRWRAGGWRCSPSWRLSSGWPAAARPGCCST